MSIQFKRNKRASFVLMSFLLVMMLGCVSSPASSSNLAVFSQSGDGIRYTGHLWSPNGRWLASESTDTAYISLFSASGQLVNELRLGCILDNGVGDFSWLPDGRLSCFIGNEPPLLDVITLDQKGQVKQSTSIHFPITPGTGVYALQWNLHHFWLATIAEATPGEGAKSSTLYLSDLQNHSLISPMPVNAQDLAWSPDGTELGLVEQNGDVELLHIQQTPTGKLTITGTSTLHAGTSTGEGLAWSPSGHWIVCRHGSYQSEDYLFLLATDGSGKQVKLTSSTTDGQLNYPAWSPDGKQMIVTRVSDGSLMSLDIASLLKQKGVTP